MIKPIRKLLRSAKKRRNEWKNQQFLSRIESSGVFDRQFYLEVNDDVRESGVDPLRHYVDIGWQEQRRPHAGFDPRYYHAAHWDSIGYHTNPLAHYIQGGCSPDRLPNLWCEGGADPGLFGFVSQGNGGTPTPANDLAAQRGLRLVLVAPHATRASRQVCASLISSVEGWERLASFAAFSHISSSERDDFASTTCVELNQLSTGRNHTRWQIERLIRTFDDDPPVCICVAGNVSCATAKQLLCDETDLLVAMDRDAMQALGAAAVRGAAQPRKILSLEESTESSPIPLKYRDVVERCSWDELCSTVRQSLSDRCRPVADRLRQQKLEKPLVVFSTPGWSISGVNTFTELLAKELPRYGFRTEILFTRNPYHSGAIRHLPDVPFRILSRGRPSSEQQWEMIVDRLNRSAPCIYVPNYDYFASSVSGVLNDSVGIVGIVHSDDLDHYEHVNRLGRYWNQIVAVSKRIHEETIAINPGWANKTSTIHYGIEAQYDAPPRIEPVKSHHPEPLRLIYTGRLVNYQKEVMDFVPLASRLHEAGVDFELKLVGDGECRPDLEAELSPMIESGQVKITGRLSAREIAQLLDKSDVFLLMSSFEGLPLSLLEAFKYGCVPLVNTISSGIPDVIDHGKNGFVFPKTDLESYVQTIQALHHDRARLESMKCRAAETLQQKSLTVDQMACRYSELFRQVLADVSTGRYRRPPVLLRSDHLGKLLLPPHLIHHPDDVVWSRRRNRAA